MHSQDQWIWSLSIWQSCKHDNLITVAHDIHFRLPEFLHILKPPDNLFPKVHKYTVSVHQASALFFILGHCPPPSLYFTSPPSYHYWQTYAHRAARRCQGVLGAVRSFQEMPGAVRSCKELSTEVKRCNKLSGMSWTNIHNIFNQALKFLSENMFL